jgi:transposase
MPRSAYSATEKLAILNEFKSSQLPAKTFARQHGISPITLRQWQSRHVRDGIEGLEEAHRNKHYSALFKLAVVQAYVAGEGTQIELANRFGLRSKTQLRAWVSKYNGENTLTASPSRKQVPTMSRKTNFEERIEVVEYVTKDKHSYAEAAEHFQVSYQQARSWVLKAKDGGYEALMDNRGHRKAQVDLTETDKLKLEVRRLKAELKDKELIEAFAKKLLELQRKG